MSSLCFYTNLIHGIYLALDRQIVKIALINYERVCCFLMYSISPIESNIIEVTNFKTWKYVIIKIKKRGNRYDAFFLVAFNVVTYASEKYIVIFLFKFFFNLINTNWWNLSQMCDKLEIEYQFLWGNNIWYNCKVWKFCFSIHHHTHAHVPAHTRVRTHIHICIYVCIYVHIYVCMGTHICIYIYWKENLPNNSICHVSNF